MARLFTLDFEFRNMHYTAVVACQKKEDDGSFRVSIYDEALHHLLPEGKLFLNTIDDSENRKNSGSAIDDLRSSVSKAILQHLKKAPR